MYVLWNTHVREGWKKLVIVVQWLFLFIRIIVIVYYLESTINVTSYRLEFSGKQLLIQVSSILCTPGSLQSFMYSPKGPYISCSCPWVGEKRKFVFVHVAC